MAAAHWLNCTLVFALLADMRTDDTVGDQDRRENADDRNDGQ